MCLRRVSLYIRISRDLQVCVCKSCLATCNVIHGECKDCPETVLLNVNGELAFIACTGVALCQLYTLGVVSVIHVL